ncbi:MAG: aminopeptidase [Chloroflexota bacterium]
MADSRIVNFAKVLVEHSARIVAGDRVLLEATPAALPLVRELYAQILEKGAYPLPMVWDWSSMMGNDELFFRHAKNEEQLDFIHPFMKMAYDQFESRIRIHSATNTRALSSVDPARIQRRGKALATMTEAQFRRGAEGKFKWVTTLYPTEGYAMEAKMSLKEYEDFVFGAVHANEADPIAHWKKIEKEQEKAIKWIEGKNQVVLRGPNVDLTLSVKGRKFMNSTGMYNMPDGEIYTGPVEDSVNGWVRFTYPAIYGGSVVDGVELTFSQGRVTQASAKENQDFLLKMLESDAGARYLGEFAIGTNFEINRFTSQILFDEKIGGTFHMALGAGYPETGSKNKSAIHWDMICDLRTDSEITVDGQPFYKNGKFVFK